MSVIAWVGSIAAAVIVGALSFLAGGWLRGSKSRVDEVKRDLHGRIGSVAAALAKRSDRFRGTVFAAEIERIRRAREQARVIGELVVQFRDVPDAEIARNLLAARMHELGASAFADADPIVLLREQRQAEALRIDRERLELDRQKVALDERLVQIQRERLELAQRLAAAKAAAATAAKKLEQASAGGRSVPPDVLAHIARDLYGIGEAAPAAGEATPADLG